MEVVGFVAVDVIRTLGILAGNGTVSEEFGLKEPDVTLETEIAYLFIKLLIRWAFRGSSCCLREDVRALLLKCMSSW